MRDNSGCAVRLDGHRPDQAAAIVAEIRDPVLFGEGFGRCPFDFIDRVDPFRPGVSVFEAPEQCFRTTGQDNFRGNDKFRAGEKPGRPFHTRFLNRS